MSSAPGLDCRCAGESERRADQLSGTAAPGHRWLLIEQPGPWGRVALRQSRLDPAVGNAVIERAVAVATRVVLIRRPGRTVDTGTRRWALADARPGREEVRWGTFEQDTDLLSLPLDGTAGTPSPDPVYLVCTHGKHDTCCAVRGKPAAAALAEVRPEQTWECSHVGGDRFAANLVVLPHGFYYAHTNPANIADIVTRYEHGEVDPVLLRGRASLPAPAQAAQQHARVALGERGVDALPLEAMQMLDKMVWRVRFTHPKGPVTVTVRADVSTTTGLLTCSSRIQERTRVYRLLDLVAPGV